MFCRNCGKENPNNSEFCSYCGTKFLMKNVEKENTVAYEKNKDKKKVPQRLIIPIIVSLSAIAFLLIVGSLIKYFVPISEEKIGNDLRKTPGLCVEAKDSIDCNIDTVATSLTSSVVYVDVVAYNFNDTVEFFATYIVTYRPSLFTWKIKNVQIVEENALALTEIDTRFFDVELHDYFDQWEDKYDFYSINCLGHVTILECPTQKINSNGYELYGASDPLEIVCMVNALKNEEDDFPDDRYYVYFNVTLTKETINNITGWCVRDAEVTNISKS